MPSPRLIVAPPALSKHISLKPLQLHRHCHDNNDLLWLFFSSPSTESKSVLVVEQPQEEPAIPVEQPMTVVTEDKEEDVVIKEEESPQDVALEPCPGLQCRALYTLSQCLLQAWKEQRVSAACSQAFHALQDTRTKATPITFAIDQLIDRINRSINHSFIQLIDRSFIQSIVRSIHLIDRSIHSFDRSNDRFI